MDFASYLDSTNLRPEASGSEIETLCIEAVNHKMAAVCVHPYRLPTARGILAGSRVKLCTVIGFPLGADGLKSKVFSARDALNAGAEELDMVINLGAIKDQKWEAAMQEIKAVLDLKNEYYFTLKVIVETALLTIIELETVTKYLNDVGADYIKTSTGFASRGVSMQDIDIINKYRTDNLKIKASGGIRELQFALALLGAGADRLGTSNAGPLLVEYNQR